MFLRIARLSGYGAACIAGLVFAYLIAALAGTVWRTGGAEWGEGGETRTVYVLSNGFHSDIVLPVSEAPDLPIASGDFDAGLSGARYLIVGWGSQTAYTSLLALSDLTPEIIVKALMFDRSVMHVQPWSGSIESGEGVYPVALDDSQYRRLVAFISATFSTGGEARAELLDGITQGYGDVFYRARPRFSMFYGCNAWTGEALRTAGVPFGIWTPFAQSIEWNMRRLASRSGH
jgi:uncharacterized protein (TIGR02117 family)